MKKLRGLAAMSPERRKAIQRKGGKTTAERGTGNRFNEETARIAGKKSKRQPRKLVRFLVLEDN